MSRDAANTASDFSNKLSLGLAQFSAFGERDELRQFRLILIPDRI